MEFRDFVRSRLYLPTNSPSAHVSVKKKEDLQAKRLCLELLLTVLVSKGCNLESHQLCMQSLESFGLVIV